MNAEEHRESDIDRIRRILGRCGAIEGALAEIGNSEIEFIRNRMCQWSCALVLSYIGEDSVKLSSEITDSHPEIDWNCLSRCRKFTSHDYAGTHQSHLWRQLSNRIPMVRGQFEKLACEIADMNVISEQDAKEHIMVTLTQGGPK